MSYNPLRQFTRNAVVRAEGADFEAGVVPAILSTGDVARDGARIQQDGWELAHFRENPVVLFNHDDGGGGMFAGATGTLPIATSSDERLVGGQLQAVAHFRDTDLAQEVLHGIEDRVVNATSVRWLPIEHEIERERLDPDDEEETNVLVFTRQELLEWSFVVIPADPGAMILRADGSPIDPSTLSVDPLDDLSLVEAVDTAHALVERLTPSDVFTSEQGEAAARLYESLTDRLRAAGLIPPSAGDEIARTLDALIPAVRALAERAKRVRQGPDVMRMVADAMSAATGRPSSEIYNRIKEA